jgi:lipid-A-disaccharide synthase-like uncharacterized protein
MELNNYIFEKETVHEKASVSQSGQSTRGKGTLACTSKRVVYVNDNEVTDISINSVDAMKYSKKKYPRIYGIAGSGLFGIAILALILSLAADMNAAFAIAFWAAVIAGILLVVGFLVQKATLEIYTPNETFRFTSSDDLGSLTHMIRAQESK